MAPSLFLLGEGGQNKKRQNHSKTKGAHSVVWGRNHRATPSKLYESSVTGLLIQIHSESLQSKTKSKRGQSKRNASWAATGIVRAQRVSNLRSPGTAHSLYQNNRSPIPTDGVVAGGQGSGDNAPWILVLIRRANACIARRWWFGAAVHRQKKGQCHHRWRGQSVSWPSRVFS